MQTRASFNDDARGFHAGAVSGDARQMAVLRPASVAIHDDGEVLGKAFGVDLFEKRRILTVGRLQELASFHRQWLEDFRGQSSTGDNTRATAQCIVPAEDVVTRVTARSVGGHRDSALSALCYEAIADDLPG